MNDIKIAVGYLGHHEHRSELHKIAFHYVKKIKEENKKKLFFLLMFNDNQKESHWIDLHRDLKNHGINCSLTKFTTKLEDGGYNYLNYFNKCVRTIELRTEYCCKMDEDMWISNHSWDCIIENINILDDPTNLCLTPLVSNGVPTTDYYIENIFTDIERNSLYDIFYNKKIDDFMWGVNYSSLNTLKSISDKWDASKFYSLVSKIQHHYKGIHPCRFSKEAQILINDYTLKHYEKIHNPQNYEFYIDQPVYLCNGFHFIKREKWEKIFKDSSVWPSGNALDEVPMNLYREKLNLNCVYLNNAYSVHPFHNGIENFDKLEVEYTEKYKNLISTL